MEFPERVDLDVAAVLVILVWRALLKERFEKTRDAEMLAGKLELEKHSRDQI